MRLASGNLKKITLECGGKSANIILDDADMGKAVKGAVFAMFFNAGQVCTAGSRLLLPDSIHDRFMELMVAETRRLVIGDGLDDPDMGPVVSLEQMEKDLRYIGYGIEDGAELVTGGARLGRTGYFVEPTIFDRVESESRIAQEEIFGPVLSVLTYSDEAEAIEIANDTRYGLAGAVWSEDVSRAKRVASRIRAGIGRELGTHGLKSYLEVKHVMVG
jgi:acyl-CoA reductase-like NAD-dependent aldehyde dehydrogenase